MILINKTIILKLLNYDITINCVCLYYCKLFYTFAHLHRYLTTKKINKNLKI